MSNLVNFKGRWVLLGVADHSKAPDPGATVRYAVGLAFTWDHLAPVKREGVVMTPQAILARINQGFGRTEFPAFSLAEIEQALWRMSAVYEDWHKTRGFLDVGKLPQEQGWLCRVVPKA